MIIWVCCNFDRSKSHGYVNNWINRSVHGRCVLVWPVQCLWKELLANITRGLWLAKCPGRCLASRMKNVGKWPKLPLKHLSEWSFLEQLNEGQSKGLCTRLVRVNRLLQHRLKGDQICRLHQIDWFPIGKLKRDLSELYKQNKVKTEY